MEFSRRNNFFAVVILLVFFASGANFVLSENKTEVSVEPAEIGYAEGVIAAMQSALLAAIDQNTSAVKQEPALLPALPQKLSNPPQIINAVYVTGWSAGSKKYANYLNNLFKNTQINAVVIDIKDYSGLVSYKSDAPEVKKYKLYSNAIKDIDALVDSFHKQNIYVIGRISVFEDPAYSKARPELAIYDKTKTLDLTKPVLWRGSNKSSWLDPASQEAWDYNISLAKDILRHGFDEVNFDYIRFPSDGNIKNVGYPVWDGKKLKAEVIKEFFDYARRELEGAKISADLFGQTAVNKDDMGIGQFIEDSFGSFDFVAPMVYPSHYAKNFIGYKNPAEHPYEIIRYSMDKALEREVEYINKNIDVQPEDFDVNKEKVARFRPWIQDFDMGAVYTADMVQAEIQAVKDALGNEYRGVMLWSPANIYTQEAILK